MTQGSSSALPPTPYEPPWWEHPPVAQEPAPITTSSPATGARDAAAAFRSKSVAPWRQPTREMIDEVISSREYVGASTPTMLIAYITIGNSDDKLGQFDWADFVRQLKETLTDFAGRTYGEWYSAPDSTWQNMCICREVNRDDLDRLRAALRELRRFYRQDSVALVTSSRTEMV